MRDFIRNSDLSVAALSRLLNISESTVRKWRKRDSVEDASHAPRHMNTTMTSVQEYVVVELRKSLLLSLDELVQVTREFINPDVSRAGLARCLKRHGVSRLAGIKDGDIDAAADLDEDPVRMHIEERGDEHSSGHEAINPEVSRDALAKVLSAGDANSVVSVASKKLPKLSDNQPERCLFIASDPDSRWVYVDIYEDDAVDAASRYMSHALNKAPFHIRRILAGNYNEFMRRYRLVEDEADSAEIPSSVGNEATE
jgi:transposase-like protein